MNDANNTNTIKTTLTNVLDIHPGSIIVYAAILYIVAFRNVEVTTRPGITGPITRHRVVFTLDPIGGGVAKNVKYLPEGVMDVVKLVGGVEVTDATLNAMYAGR